MMGLTKVQAATLQAIRDLTVDGVPPTYRQIAAHVGLASKSGVHRTLRELAQRGAVRMTYRQPQSLRLVDQMPPRLDTLSATEFSALQAAVEREAFRRMRDTALDRQASA